MERGAALRRVLGGPRSEGQVSESRLNAVRGEVRDPGEDLGVRSLQKHRKRFLRNVKRCRPFEHP